MNRKTLLVTSLIALLALPVLAQPRGMHGGAAGFEKHQQMLAKQLDLTPEQLTTLNQLSTDLQTKLAPIHQAGKATHTQLKSALAGDSPDAAQVGQLVISMHQNRQQAKAAMDSFQKSFQASLTPDQLTKLQALKANHPHPRFQSRAAAGDPAER